MVAAQRALEISDLRQIVLDRIHEKPKATEADIGVSTDRGIVTLTGRVTTKEEKIAVETVVKQVPGVTAVANDLWVEPLPDRSNTEIAKDVLGALQRHIFLAGEDIRVIV